VLLGLTYLREQDVWGWHRHDTDGDIEQICVVPEATEDALYAIIRRTIGGTNKRYIERLASRQINDFDEDAFFVDSGLSYSGTPTAALTGLSHLNGKTVAIVADGDYVGTQVVSGGAIALSTPASNVHAGLPIAHAEIETLDLDATGTDIRDKAKRVGSVTLLVDRSARGFEIGPNSTDVTPYEDSVFDAVEDETTGQLEITLPNVFEKPGRVFLRQTEPLPITLLGIMPNVAVGG
jgi:hypothetical protein